MTFRDAGPSPPPWISLGRAFCPHGRSSPFLVGHQVRDSTPAGSGPRHHDADHWPKLTDARGQPCIVESGPVRAAPSPQATVSQVCRRTDTPC